MSEEVDITDWTKLTLYEAVRLLEGHVTWSKIAVQEEEEEDLG